MNDAVSYIIMMLCMINGASDYDDDVCWGMRKVFLLAKTIFNVYLSSVCGVSTRLLLVALLQACYQLS